MWDHPLGLLVLAEGPPFGEVDPLTMNEIRHASQDEFLVALKTEAHIAGEHPRI